MGKIFRWAALPLVGSLALCALFLWSSFAPPSLGGDTSVFVTQGQSMTPLLNEGDVAIVRSESHYEIGDVVAYKSPQLGQTVLHRVVSIESGRLVTKGDANAQLDLDRPAPSEITGKMVRSFTGLGLQTERMRSGVLPVLLSFLVAGVGFVAVMRRRPADAVATVPKADRSGSAAPIPLIVLAGLTVVAIGLSTIWASGTPREFSEVTYNHNGRFVYSGKASGVGAEVVYPDDLKTGQPAYGNLVKTIDFEFAYDLASDVPFQGGGTAEMHATLRNQTGWSATIPIAAKSNFDGSTVQVQGSLRLDELIDLAENLQTFTLSAPQSYSVDIAPVIAINGTLHGQSLADEFTPVLSMRLESSVLQLDGSRPQEQSGLQQSEGGLISTPTNRGESQKQPLSVLLALFGLFAVLAVVRYQRVSPRVSSEAPSKIINCPTLGDLAHLALTADVPIVENTRDGSTTYLAHHEGLTYKFSEASR